MQCKHPALVVIDLQNDYFADGQFPLWHADETRAQVEIAIRQAQARGMPVILVQHVADATKGIAPFFNAGTEGVEIHPAIRALAPEAPIVIKQFADSFLHTSLQATLQQLGCDGLLLCGMMTQNCVTHTALSRQADSYEIAILQDACTTVSEILHRIALSAIAPRIPLLSVSAM